MSIVNLQMEQNDIIRRILDIKDTEFLARIKELIVQNSQTKENAMTKEEIIAGLEEAFQTAKKAREGKIKGRTIEEFLYEL